MLNKRRLSYLLIALCVCCFYANKMAAEGISAVADILRDNAQRMMQEKVYVHTDNKCYFIGDTIWYKAYVVKAADMTPTDMSRILYVELLDPSGMVVERQSVIVSADGLGDGGFALPDSIYTGFYELRAYTRWMLNFNCERVDYTRSNAWMFYNYQMASDFFRRWSGSYSRVLPIYARPDSAGDYSVKRMYQRFKTRLQPQAKERLLMCFYPEGGNMVKGLTSKVAFEITDQDGAAVNISGQLMQGSKVLGQFKTTHHGRGFMTVTPGDQSLTAAVRWKDKDYQFPLPKATESGAVIGVNDGAVTIRHAGMPADRQYGLSVMCRGVFSKIVPVDIPSAQQSASREIVIPLDSLPTGVNDITLFDDQSRIIADRLLFVNNHDLDHNHITIETPLKSQYAPYEQVTMQMTALGLSHLSFSVCDTRSDETTYDNGDMLTDLLLSSELKGFVANPAYYFEADDDTHRQALDLLMLVQGWRRYKWEVMADTAAVLRYSPEQTLTIEGGVYKPHVVDDIDPVTIGSWRKGQLTSNIFEEEEETTDTSIDPQEQSDEAEEVSAFDADALTTYRQPEGNGMYDGNDYYREVNRKGLKKEVYVEAELSIGNQIFGGTQMTTDGGRFIIQVPPFYGIGIVNMKAYSPNDSVKKNMLSRSDKNIMREDAAPDYYVKRDLFWPRFTRSYDYYEDHLPEQGFFLDTLSTLSMENDEHMLANVDVKGRRRGKRAIDLTKPAYVCDAYDIYNDITDCGLSYGMFDMSAFPRQVAWVLFGNMGRNKKFNVDGRIGNHIYYRTYNPEEFKMSYDWDNKNPVAIFNDLKLRRLDNIRIYTDYDIRNRENDVFYSSMEADATVVMQPFENDGTRPVFRDRHFLYYGITEPIDFYSPDYSTMTPEAATDHRRTIYWNPNVAVDEEGRAEVSFYNNSHTTRFRLSAAGVASDGKIYRINVK